MAKVTNADDIRTVYVYVNDHPGTAPADITSEYTKINVRYAREMLGLLAREGLLIDTEDGGYETPVKMDTGDALDTVNQWLGTQPTTEAKPETAKPATKKAASKPTNATGKCLCGCGEAVAKSNYRPGHDARHAGNVGRQVAEDVINTTKKGAVPHADLETDADRFADLPTDALKAKALRVANNAIAKHVKASAK